MFYIIRFFFLSFLELCWEDICVSISTCTFNANFV